MGEPIIVKLSPWSDAKESTKATSPPPAKKKEEDGLEEFIGRVGIFLFLLLAAGIIAILEFIFLK